MQVCEPFLRFNLTLHLWAWTCVRFHLVVAAGLTKGAGSACRPCFSCIIWLWSDNNLTVTALQLPELYDSAVKSLCTVVSCAPAQDTGSPGAAAELIAGRSLRTAWESPHKEMLPCETQQNNAVNGEKCRVPSHFYCICGAWRYISLSFKRKVWFYDFQSQI